MRLTIEQQGAFYTLEVTKVDATGPQGITGMRRINRIALFRKYFDDFITALTIDDFEAVKAIFEGVIDAFTKELLYKNVDSIRLLTDQESQEIEENALF